MSSHQKLEIVKVKQDIMAWSENFVEVPNPKLGGWAPCPYARRARMENKVDIRLGNDLTKDAEQCINTWDDKFEVVIYAYAVNDYSAEQVADAADHLNKDLLNRQDFLVLEDHPHSVEEVNGLCFNQGQYILMLYQRLSKVNEFSEFLKEKGYYDTWTKNYYDSVVSWRTQRVSDDC